MFCSKFNSGHPVQCVCVLEIKSNLSSLPSQPVIINSKLTSINTTSYRKTQRHYCLAEQSKEQKERERMASIASESTTLKNTNKTNAPYGSWKSPITADLVSGSDKRLEGFTLDSHGRLLWLETRPSESGHVILLGNQTLHPSFSIYISDSLFFLL